MPHRKGKGLSKPVRRAGSRLHIELARSIGEGILNGTYGPGTLLPNEAEWGAMFGASRTAVREAIKTLNGKGLLVSRPKIGSRVEPRERWNFLDRDVLAWHCSALDRRTLLASIQEVRRILEPGAASLAAAKRSPLQLARLQAAVDGMRNALSAEDMIAPDIEFHLALLAAANNELLIPFGIIIEQALRQMFVFTSRSHPEPHSVVALHQAVVDAVGKSDPPGAAAAVAALLKDTDELIAAAPATVARGPAAPPRGARRPA